MSLSFFIRRNLFIPIQLLLVRNGGHTRPLLCGAIAIFAAFELGGLWHGISIGWLGWGMFHGLGLVGVRAYGEFLNTALGPAGMKAYRNSKVLYLCRIAVTFEYVALSFFPVYYFGAT